MTTTTTPVPTSTGSFPVIQDPLAHVGSLVRSARQHRGLTQAQLAERLATSQSRDPPHRAGRAERQPRDADPHRRRARLPHRHARRPPAHAPARAGRPDAERADRRQHQQERRRRAAVRVAAQPGHHAAAERRPHRRGGPDRRGAALRRRPRHLVDRTAATSRSSSRGTSTSGPSTSTPPAAPGRSSCSSGPLLGLEDEFRLPYAGGCDLGTRTVEPHLIGLRPFGLDVTATAGDYHGLVTRAARRTCRSS